MVKKTDLKCHLWVRKLATGKDLKLSLPMPVEALDEVLGDSETEILDAEEIWASTNIPVFTNLRRLNDFLIDLTVKVKAGLDFGRLLAVCHIRCCDIFEALDALKDFIFIPVPEEVNEWMFSERYEKVVYFILENAREIVKNLPNNIRKDILTFDGVNPTILDKRIFDYLDYEAIWSWYETSGFGFTYSKGKLEYVYKELSANDRKEV